MCLSPTENAASGINTSTTEYTVTWIFLIHHHYIPFIQFIQDNEIIKSTVLMNREMTLQPLPMWWISLLNIRTITIPIENSSINNNLAMSIEYHHQLFQTMVDLPSF